MKTGRHARILDIIAEHPIETQDELLTRLREEGFKATQATISRDIRELRLSKVNSHDGKQKYVIMPVKERGLNDKLSKVLKEGYISSMEASNLVVVKTATGMAMAVATALDAMELPGFAGCIAGDDTVMCALHAGADVEMLLNRINKVVNQ